MLTRVSCLALAITCVLGSAATAHASTIVVLTDATWLSKNSAPGAGWNTNPGFNTTTDGGWRPASDNGPDCNGLQDCIWYDGATSQTTTAYFRQTFTLDGPAISGSFQGGADDDAMIWLNGNLIYNVQDGIATQFTVLNLAPYLVPGVNLLAVMATDNYLVYGYQHTFHGQLNAETAATTPSPVPEPASLILFGSGLTGLFARYRRRTI